MRCIYSCEQVVDIMRVNVDKVLERDQKLSELDDRADALQAGASQFETSAAKLKRKFWWKNCKVPWYRTLPSIIDSYMTAFAYWIKAWHNIRCSCLMKCTCSFEFGMNHRCKRIVKTTINGFLYFLFCVLKMWAILIAVLIIIVITIISKYTVLLNVLII